MEKSQIKGIESRALSLWYFCDWTRMYGKIPNSGQILARIKEDIQDWRSQLAQGNLENIKGWLVKNVHSHGDLYDSADLIKKITGKKLDAKPYVGYLEEK